MESRSFIDRALEELEELEDREDKILGFLDLVRYLCRQPVILAAFPLFRLSAIQKIEEITRDVLKEETPHEEDFLEATFKFGDLLSELHDHPLFVDD